MKRKRGRRIAAAILLPALLWFVWFENNTISSETVTVEVSGLPESFEGFRIVLLTDLHGKTFGQENGRLLELVRAARPDMIAVCGDIVDRREELEIVPALANELCQIAPTYFVTGNHEWACGVVSELLPVMEEAGVNVLENEYLRLELAGESIVLAGVHDPNGPYDMLQPEELAEQIAMEEADAPVLMLAHRNDQIEKWAALDVDLVLTGHGHGGAIRLPFIGGLFGTDRTLLPAYTAGLYCQEDTQMVVSRGLGNSGIPFRLFNRPDLPVVILSAK